MVLKAKFLYWMDGSRVYEYRGREYDVNPRLYTPTATQHRQEQLRIDAQIEEESHRDPSFVGEPADVAFDRFWQYVNGEISEDEF